MANNFAEAFFGGQRDAQQSRMQQEQAEQSRLMNTLKIESAQTEMANSAEDRQRKMLVSMARGWKSLQAQDRPAYYERFIKPAIAKEWGDPGPYNEAAVDGVANQIIAGMGGGTTNPYEGLPSDIQSLQLLRDNPELAALDRERRQAAGMVPKLVDTSQGIGWGTPGAGIDLAPINGVAGGAGNGGFGIKETNDYVRSILGKVQGLDPSAPAEKQAEVLLPYLIQQESSGDPNAVSPKGAQGLTQVMPATGRDPGFGVSPLRDNSPQENVRFGRDYLTAMLRRYPGRPDLALAAYNAGPGVADRFANPQASASPNIAQPYRAPAADPAGYRRNAQGDLEFIPGGPADPFVKNQLTGAQQEKIAQRKQKEQQLLSANEAGIDQTIALIDSLLSKKGDFYGVTGLGSAMSRIPGSDFADIAAALDTLRGRSAFGALQQMRANSPTGGALGSVTERELGLLQNSETQLQNTQSPEALVSGLENYRNTLMETRRRMREGFDQFYQEQGPQQDEVARPTSDAEYNALPSGALFIDPDDGKQYRKP